MPFFLGTVGNLQEIPSPQRGLDVTMVRKGGTHELLSGGIVRDTIGFKRTYKPEWLWLTQDEIGTLEALYAGTPGPLALIDPSRRNHLEINQAAATGAFQTTEGFVTNTGSLAVETTVSNSIIPTPNSLRWTTTGALGSTSNGPKTGASYSTATMLDDIPVFASGVYSFSVYALRSSTNAISCQAVLEWYTTSGSFISRALGNSTALSTSAWNRLQVANQTAPATAAFAKMGIWNSATTLGATTVYSDGWQLELATAPTTWALGTGVPLVIFDALATQIIHKPGVTAPARYNAQGVLVEAI